MSPTAEDTLQGIFRAVLELSPATDVRTLHRDQEPRWDSLAHVSLVLAIESEFDVAIDPADSLELTSYSAAHHLLDKLRA